jgi:hypothetical protein
MLTGGSGLSDLTEPVRAVFFVLDTKLTAGLAEETSGDGGGRRRGRRGGGGVSRRRRTGFSAALDQRQVGEALRSPGTRGALGARPAPARSLRRARGERKMSGRFLPAVWFFSGKQGGLL